MFDVEVQSRVAASAAAGGVIPESEAKGLAVGAPQRALIGQPLDQLAPRGSVAHAMLTYIKESVTSSDALLLRHLPPQVAQRLLTDPSLRSAPPDLSGLPPDVAQKILDDRAKAIEQFFSSWSESMARNAAADQEATLRRLLLQNVMNQTVAGGALTAERATQVAPAGVRIRNPDKESEMLARLGRDARDLMADGGRPLPPESTGGGALKAPQPRRTSIGLRGRTA